MPAPDSLQTALQAKGRPLALAAGQVLFRRGQRPVAFYWVLAGEVRLQRAATDGRGVILQRCRAGPLAEASVFSSAYHCDAVAARPSRLLRLERRALLDLLTQGAFASAYVQQLSHELRQLRARCERLSLPRARDRILHALDEQGALHFGPGLGSLKDWAAELGLTHEALYRSLRQLQRQGLIARRPGLIAPAGRPGT